MHELNGKVLCACKDIVKAFYALIEKNSSAYSEIMMAFTEYDIDCTDMEDAFMELAHVEDILLTTESDTDEFSSVFLISHGRSASHASEFRMRWHTAATGD